MTALDLSTLSPAWTRVVVEETPGGLVVPETGTYARKFDDDIADGVYVHAAGYEIVSKRVAAIRRIDTDEPTTWITRPVTTTRRWAVQPPNDETQCILLRLLDGKPWTVQFPGRALHIMEDTFVAYARLFDLLTTPSPVVEVTAEHVRIAMIDAGVGISRISDEALADAAQTINERTARPPAAMQPFTGEEIGETIRSLKCAGYSSDMHNQIAARLNASRGLS